MMRTRLLKYSSKSFLPNNYFFSPEWIILGVNNTCKLNCKIYDVSTQSVETNFAKNLLGNSPLNMPFDLYRDIIDQTQTYVPPAKIGFAFTEPFAYPFIVEALSYATEKNIFTSLTTHTLLLPKKVKELVWAGLKKIFISLDGIESIHNKIRGHQKSFSKATEGIEKRFSSPTPSKISRASVIKEWNISALKEFTNYVKPYPIEAVPLLHSLYGTPEVAATKNNGALYTLNRA